MSRTLRILLIAVVALVLTAPAWGDKAEDIEQVRKILQKEQDSWRKGDREQLMSCFAPGFVGYQAWGGRFNLINVSHIGLDSLRANYVSQVPEGGYGATLAKHPERTVRFEVIHIDVKDNHAIGLTKHFGIVPDTTARETIIGEFESLWMLAKIEGEWKITSFIGQISSEQTVWKQGPE